MDVGVLVGGGVGLGVNVGVLVGLGVSVSVGVRLGIGLLVGAWVGPGVMDGGNVGVPVGAATRVGTLLAIARSVLTATGGWILSDLRGSHRAAINTSTTPSTIARVINAGRSQPRGKGSPQAEHTSSLRLFTVPQCRQRTRRDCR